MPESASSAEKIEVKAPPKNVEVDGGMAPTKAVEEAMEALFKLNFLELAVLGNPIVPSWLPTYSETIGKKDWF